MGLELLNTVPWELAIPKDVSLRQTSLLCRAYDSSCIDVMRVLTTKYADGYEGWAQARGEEVCLRKGSQTGKQPDPQPDLEPDPNPRSGPD